VNPLLGNRQGAGSSRDADRVRAIMSDEYADVFLTPIGNLLTLVQKSGSAR
jgi:hypothetical protein